MYFWENKCVYMLCNQPSCTYICTSQHTHTYQISVLILIIVRNAQVAQDLKVLKRHSPDEHDKLYKNSLSDQNKYNKYISSLPKLILQI